MPSKNVRDVFNRGSERYAVASGMARLTMRRWRIVLATACYGVWLIACCLGPGVLVQWPYANGSVLVPAWVAPLFFMALASAVIAVRFKKTRRVLDDSSWPVVLACFMTLAAVVHFVWALDRALPPVADVVLYILASVITGVSAALFRVEIDRVYGWIGTQQTLYQGVAGTLVAVAALLACAWMGNREPQGFAALYCMGLVLPFALAILMRRIVKGFPRVRYFEHGRDLPLPFPAKFVATSAVQGFAAGVFYQILFELGALGQNVFSTAYGQIMGAVLLFATLAFLRLDFNRFVYKVAFPFVAVGFLMLGVCPDASPAIIVFLGAGFCYLDLVLWSLGACLMKNMGLPATWVASCPGSALCIGAVCGALAACALINGYSLSDMGMYMSVIACMLFAAALFMSSSSNLKYGRGAVLPGEGALDDGGLAGIARFMAIDHELTQRETEVLLLLAAGKTRRAICDELTVSLDTVKSHVRAVYRKFDVHSQQELIDRICAERDRMGECPEEGNLG